MEGNKLIKVEQESKKLTLVASDGVSPFLMDSTAKKLGRNRSITSPSPVAAAPPTYE